MVLSSFFNRKAESKERLKAIQEEARLQQIAEMRLKGANERELITIMERERQDAIAEELKEIRRNESSMFFRSNMFFDQNKQVQAPHPTQGNLDRGNMLNSSNMFFS